MIQGCTDNNACNRTPYAQVDDGSCEYPEYPSCSCTEPLQYDCEGTCRNVSADDFMILDDCGVCRMQVGDASWNSTCTGCRDENACNFDSSIIFDCDGVFNGFNYGSCCVYPVAGACP